MVSKELLDILVCPYCKTKVELREDRWLLCQNPDCRRKYPIKDDIPVMLVEEGDKWKDTAPEDLPDPATLRF
ncbi:MAG: Trm112 family protein [Anaerolineae bacterium]|nr:Trm112 family protein [Anaerolineae bacterium]